MNRAGPTWGDSSHGNLRWTTNPCGGDDYHDYQFFPVCQIL